MRLMKGCHVLTRKNFMHRNAWRCSSMCMRAIRATCKVCTMLHPARRPFWRSLAGLVCLLASWRASAVSRIEIHVGEIRHPAAQIENVTATLDTDGRWQGKATLKRGDLTQVAREYPQYPLPVTISKGTFDGKAAFSGEGRELRRVEAVVDVHDVAFSDAAGLHAGEKVGGQFKLNASHAGERWLWQGSLDWLEGEVFWQPLYFPSGGQVLKARGWLSPPVLAVEGG